LELSIIIGEKLGSKIMPRKSFVKAEELFRQNSGILRTSQAKKLGINEYTLVQMTEAGLLIREARGLYRLADLPPLSNPDLVKVSMRVPDSVICLISALNFHNLTTQIPYRVYIALPRSVKAPRLDYPPLDIVYLSLLPYTTGIEDHNLDGAVVRIYNREKTIADCFKFRNKIGQDIALEALQDYLRLPDRQLNLLLEYASIDRVKNIMRPYLEASL
jgi:predicted transcriptional regulator of viral defense system